MVFQCLTVLIGSCRRELMRVDINGGFWLQFRIILPYCHSIVLHLAPCYDLMMFALILYFLIVTHKAPCHVLSKVFLKSMKTLLSTKYVHYSHALGSIVVNHNYALGSIESCIRRHCYQSKDNIHTLTDLNVTSDNIFLNITKTCLYNFDPLKPHFYIVKLGFTGVYIIFLISAQKHRLWVLVRTASSRRF